MNEKEEKLKEHIQEQVSRLDNGQSGTILRDNGLDPDIWYKRVKTTGLQKVSSKVDNAILKQL